MSQTKAGPKFRIIKDELPDGRGYRLTFEIVPGKAPLPPLLPLNPSDPKYLEMIAGITRKRLDEPEGSDEPLFVYASLSGIALLQEMGSVWVMNTLLKIDDKKELEPETKLIAGTRPCTVRRIPKVKTMQGSARLLRSETEVQNYLKRFGVTTRVSEALQQVAAQLTTFKLEPALEEYVAGNDFMLCEYRVGTTLQDIKLEVEGLMHAQDPGNFGMTKRQWMYWFEQFATEMTYLRELFFMVGYEKGEPYTQANFSLSNWLCSGIDAKTGRPQLTLIDQSPALLGGPDSVLDTDDMARSVRYRELMGLHGDDGLLVRLRK